MPHNGETNRRFGAYKNLCCGKEVVMTEGSVFPDCPEHPNLPTIWKPIDGPQSNKLPKGAEFDFKRVPRFEVGDQVRVIGVDENKGKLGLVIQVLESRRDFVHRYDVRFSDGTSIRYFGFQLDTAQSKSA